MRAALWLPCVFALAGASVSAQQAPAAADLPAAYRGGAIEHALTSRDWAQAEQQLATTIERTPDSPALLEVLGSVFLIEQELSLEVGDLDEITVHDAQESDPRPGQDLCLRPAEGAAPHNRNPRVCNVLLSLLANAGEPALA